MKIVITTLDFHKDPTFDPEGLIKRDAYIVQYKRHWWNRLKYIMDSQTHCPRLFFDKDKALSAALDIVSG